jgi:hypothetical protein
MTITSLNMAMKFRLNSAKCIGHLIMTLDVTTISRITNNNLININMSDNGTTTTSVVPSIGQHSTPLWNSS